MKPLATDEGIQQRAKLYSVELETMKGVARKYISERNVIETVMELVVDTQKKMTNDPGEIKRIYYANKQRCRNIQVGEQDVDRIVTDFFSIENTAKRLVCYKDVVNKSKRYAKVPLYQFYVQMQPDEKLIYMVEKSNKIMIKLAEDE